MESGTTETWERLVDVLRQFHLLTRLKWFGDAMPTIWEYPLFIPTSGYLEMGSLGPVSFSTVEWVEIDTIEIKRIGRLVPPKKIDHSESLIISLQNASVKFIKTDSLIRVQATS